MNKKYLIFKIAILSYCLINCQSCTIYYVQNNSPKSQPVRIIYSQNNDRTRKNGARLTAAEKGGKIIELHKQTDGNEQVFFDFKLPPKNKLPLNKLLSSTYFDTSSYASICYPSKSLRETDTISCLRFDQLESNTKSDGIPFFLVRIEKKIFIK